MKVRPIFKEDMAEINRWLQGHGAIPLDDDDTPPLGFMVDGVAAGFLFQTGTRIGFIEMFCGNPEASRSDVYQGLELVLREAVAASRAVGIRRLITMTCRPSIAKCLRERGFEQAEGQWQLLQGRV